MVIAGPDPAIHPAKAPSLPMNARVEPAHANPTSRLLQRRHHVLGEPAQLLLEFLRAETFGPVNHEAVEAGIFFCDRLDAVDHACRRAAEPSLLRDPVAQ